MLACAPFRTGFPRISAANIPEVFEASLESYPVLALMADPVRSGLAPALAPEPSGSAPEPHFLLF